MKRNTLILIGLLSTSIACGGDQDKAPEPPSSNPNAEQNEPIDDSAPVEGDDLVVAPVDEGPSLPPSEPTPPSEEPESSEDGLPATDTLPQWKEIFAAASVGPELKGVAAYDYQWNVKPASVVEQPDGSLEISGRLSHHIVAAPDNQMDYRFVYQDGKVVASDISIQAGGWLPIAEPILDILADYTVTPIPLDAILPIIRDIEQRITGKDWQSQGQKLASRIALSLYEREMSNQP